MKREGLCFLHFASDPFFNMAFDEWLLFQAVQSPHTIYARLYTWQKPAITFGCNQNADTAFLGEEVGDTPVIRRITGGRALLHDPSELTYSISANASEGAGFSGNIGQTSQKIATIIRCFLSHYRVQSEYSAESAENEQERKRDFFHKAACFSSVSRNELTTSMGKIVGSAQRRIGAAFLQHGAIKWRGVAVHPALHLRPASGKYVETSNGESLKTVGEKEFGEASQVFLQTLQEETGVEFAGGEITESMAAVIKDRSLEISSEPLKKRDCIKQTAVVGSLSDTRNG